MKHAFSLAIKEWEWVRDNPVRKVSMEKESASRDRWLHLKERKSSLPFLRRGLRRSLFLRSRRVVGEGKSSRWNGRKLTCSREP